MTGRPLTLLLASSLTFVLALGAFLFGAFLVAIAAGAVPLLDSTVGAVVGVLGAVSIVYGGAALVAAVALIGGRVWAWPLAVAVHLVALIGVLVAAATGGFGVHIAAGLSLAAGGLIALVPSSSREALRP